MIVAFFRSLMIGDGIIDVVFDTGKVRLLALAHLTMAGRGLLLACLNCAHARADCQITHHGNYDINPTLHVLCLAKNRPDVETSYIRLHRLIHPRYLSVTAPSEAELTVLAYLANTPLV
jgi:hypothetical protein